MRKESWRKSSKTIGKYPCVESTINMNAGFGKAEYETCLAGKYGQIWEFSPGVFYVLVNNQKIINDLTPDEDYRYKKGEEKVFKATEAELEGWITRLKIPKRAIKSQLKYLNK